MQRHSVHFVMLVEAVEQWGPGSLPRSFGMWPEGFIVWTEKHSFPFPFPMGGGTRTLRVFPWRSINAFRSSFPRQPLGTSHRHIYRGPAGGSRGATARNVFTAQSRVIISLWFRNIPSTVEGMEGEGGKMAAESACSTGLILGLSYGPLDQGGWSAWAR